VQRKASLPSPEWWTCAFGSPYALKHGRLALATERGRVVRVDRTTVDS